MQESIKLVYIDENKNHYYPLLTGLMVDYKE